MEVRFTRLSNDEHSVTVVRRDGSTEEVTLNSRSFLRHDLAHFAVELELGLRRGVWGCVAAGGSLTGDGLDGDDMTVAESVAGPVQTIMRTEADAAAVLEALRRAVPGSATPDLAERIHERLRRLRGHWNATPFGEAMVLTWPLDE